MLRVDCRYSTSSAEHTKATRKGKLVPSTHIDDDAYRVFAAQARQGSADCVPPTEMQGWQSRAQTSRPATTTTADGHPPEHKEGEDPALIMDPDNGATTLDPAQNNTGWHTVPQDAASSADLLMDARTTLGENRRNHKGCFAGGSWSQPFLVCGSHAHILTCSCCCCTPTAL
jgi:hypothetical protein